jgi:hypothetical protein
MIRRIADVGRCLPFLRESLLHAAPQVTVGAPGVLLSGSSKQTSHNHRSVKIIRPRTVVEETNHAEHFPGF